MVRLNPQDDNVLTSCEVIYDAGFKKTYLNQSLSTIITVWNENSKNMDDDDYKKDAALTVDLLKQCDVQFMISDHRLNRFNISTDLQKWYGELIAYVLGNSRFEKCAVIITTDLNLLLALDEIRINIENSEKNRVILTRFFNDYKEAKKWLYAKFV